MKKDTKSFVLTMVSIPAILAAASGVHAFAVPSTPEPVLEVVEIAETPIEVPSVATTTVIAEPAKKPAVLTPVVKKAVAPVATAPQAPVVTKPKLTPVQTTVVTTQKRSRTTRAS